MRHVRFICLAGAIGIGLATGSRPARLEPVTARREARTQTAPVPHRGDAADDPAVWIHPRDPSLSLVLGTDKQGGLHSYNMAGSEQQVVADAPRPNNVDVLYGFKLEGRTVDLAVASLQASKQRGTRGVKVWAIDAATRRLSDVTQGGSIRVLGGKKPYGLCGYRSARTGRFYVFVTDERGRVEQDELTDAGGGRIAGAPVRQFAVGSTAEGCVADNDLGLLYVAEERVGIRKFGAEPEAGGSRKRDATVGENGMAAGGEGVAIADATSGRGYLIASSQGNNTYKVYERAGANRYVLTIDPKGARIDDVSDTDGIEVTSCATSPPFAQGVFIVQDGENAGGNQNFKLYAWEDIDGASLLTDSTCRVRRPGSEAPV